MAGNVESEAAAAKWAADDGKTHAELILTISPSELKQVKNCTTSHEVWTRLKYINPKVLQGRPHCSND